MHNAQIHRTVFPNRFHILVYIGKDWNSMVCSQETPVPLGPAIPRFTRIGISCISVTRATKKLWGSSALDNVSENPPNCFHVWEWEDKLCGWPLTYLDIREFVQIPPQCFSHHCDTDYSFPGKTAKSRNITGYSEESDWAWPHLGTGKFFCPSLSRYNGHTMLCKLEAHDMIIW